MHFRYTKNKYQEKGRSCNYGIMTGRDEYDKVIATSYKPKPHYKPFVLNDECKFKEIRFYRKYKDIQEEEEYLTREPFKETYEGFEILNLIPCKVEDIKRKFFYTYTNIDGVRKCVKVLLIEKIDDTNLKVKLCSETSNFPPWVINLKHKTKNFLIYVNN